MLIVSKLDHHWILPTIVHVVPYRTTYTSDDSKLPRSQWSCGLQDDSFQFFESAPAWGKMIISLKTH